MRKQYFLLITLLSVFYGTLQSQHHEFIGAFTPVTNMPCPFDTLKMIKSSGDWRIYYTKNDLPDGEIDTAVSCINIIPSFSGSIVHIEGEELIPGRPLFVRDYEVRKRREKMLSNQLYQFYYMSFFANEAVFKREDQTRQSYGINYWEREGEGGMDTVAYQTSAFLDGGTERYVWADYCHVTSKLERQEFLGSLYAVYFDSSLTRLPDIRLYTYTAISTEFNPVEEDEYIIPITGLEEEINIAAMELFRSEWPDVHLVLHTKDGYPSADNFSYKTIRLQPNPDKQKDINIQIQYSGIHFQEFTGLMSEHPEGEDSILHNIYLELLDDNLCVGIIELVFNPPLSFKYSGGNIDFTDKSSCMLVKNGAGFRVNKSAALSYGDNGKGMLALDGGTIFLEDRAKLNFEGILVLKNRPEHHAYLGKNAKLVFGKASEVWSIEGHKLYVHAYPWQVDLRGLDRSSAEKIVIVEPIMQSQEHIRIYPSVIRPSDVIYAENIADQDSLEIYDLYGRIHLEGRYHFSDGIKISSLPAGTYILKSGSKTGRFVVM
jgi:hypothetical protein